MATLVAMLGLIGLASLGFDIPILRQIVGFIFLTFIPGILILRILKVHNISTIECLVYSVGLSIAFVMFGGALIDFVLPLMGISHPISLMPVTSTLAIFTLILMAIAYVRDRGFIRSGKATPAGNLQLPPILFLILLLLLTVLGVTLVDSYQNNILLLICLIAIAGVIGLAAFGKFIQPGVYPLAIFVIGLCLLYQTTLMSPYLVGQDVYSENYFYQLTASSGFWNSSFPWTISSCLSTNILTPFYSLFLNIDGAWVFKAINPILFSLVPLILFYIFSQQISQKKAFLAAFFFVAVPTFFLEMIGLPRQQIAELFLALVILLLVDRKLNLGPKLTMLILFAMSLLASHYALGFIGAIYMGLLLPLVLVIRNGIFQKGWGWLTQKFGGLPRSITEPRVPPAKMLLIVVAIYFIFGFVWYQFTAEGMNLWLVKSLWSTQAGGAVTELGKLVPLSTELSTQPTTGPIAFFQFSQRDVLVQTALGLDFPEASPQGKGFRIFQYITELFLIVGLLRLIFRPKYLRFTAEYIAMSLVSALLLLGCIFLPGFANAFNTTRWYHLALITLAPFCILGGESIWRGASVLWQKLRRRTESLQLVEDSQGYLKFAALAVLIPYFLFTSGFIYEVTGQKVTDTIDTPYSIALSSYRLDLAGVFYWQDGAAAEWLSQRAGNETNVYCDSHTGKLLIFSKFPGHVIHLPPDVDKLKKDPKLDISKYPAFLITPSQYGNELLADGYLYFTAWNTERKEVTFATLPGLRRAISFSGIPGLTGTIDSKDRIYNNGGAQVLR